MKTANLLFVLTLAEMQTQADTTLYNSHQNYTYAKLYYVFFEIAK